MKVNLQFVLNVTFAWFWLAKVTLDLVKWFELCLLRFRLDIKGNKKWWMSVFSKPLHKRLMKRTVAVLCQTIIQNVNELLQVSTSWTYFLKQAKPITLVQVMVLIWDTSRQLRRTYRDINYKDMDVKSEDEEFPPQKREPSIAEQLHVPSYPRRRSQGIITRNRLQCMASPNTRAKLIGIAIKVEPVVKKEDDVEKGIHCKYPESRQIVAQVS